MVCEVQCTARVRNLCANGLRDSCGHASARGPGVRLCRAREGLRTSAGAQRLCAQAVFRCCVKFSSSSYRGSHWQSALGPRGQPGAVGCLGKESAKIQPSQKISQQRSFFSWQKFLDYSACKTTGTSPFVPRALRRPPRVVHVQHHVSTRRLPDNYCGDWQSYHTTGWISPKRQND